MVEPLSPRRLEPLEPLDTEPELVKVDPKALMRYIELENEIQGLEAMNALKNYELKQQAADNAEEACQEAADHLESLRISTLNATFAKLSRKWNEVTECIGMQVSQLIESVGFSMYNSLLTAQKKEKVPSMDTEYLQDLQSMFKDENSLERSKTREEEEYMEALNEEECARSKLEGLKTQLRQLRADANKIKSSAKKLKKLYEERDTMLSEIFEGEYGSDKESNLEMTLDNLNDQRQRLTDANYKWNSAKGHLQQGVKQLTQAVHRWKALFHVPPQNAPMRFMYATDTRNNLVAAQQNISSTYKYLPNINFPYCAPPEMNTLDLAINHIYSDIQTPKRHAHALECYDVTMRRASALAQWMDTVIKSTIQEDLKKTVQTVRETEQKLREERVRLMKERIIATGGDVKGLTAGLKALAEQPKVTEVEIAPEKGVGVIEAEKTAAETLKGEDEGEPEAPPPVPLSQLAPLPSPDELFGNISQLKEEHQRETEEVLKMQEVNKARMQQGLQAKLQARRKKKQHHDDDEDEED